MATRASAPSSVGAIWFADERRLLVVLLSAAMLPSAFLALEDALASRGWLDVLSRALPALVAAVSLAAIAWTPRVPVRSWSHWILVALTVALLVSSAALPDEALTPLRGQMLGPALFYLLAPNTMARQAGPALALSVGYAILRAVRVEPFLARSFVNDAVFLVVLNAAGMLRIRHRRLLEQSIDEAWAKEEAARLAAEQARADVRTIEGIIPICVHCRKLRSDAGVWQKLELYVHERTGAAFTHGLCPECLETHYPEP